MSMPFINFLCLLVILHYLHRVLALKCHQFCNEVYYYGKNRFHKKIAKEISTNLKVDDIDDSFFFFFPELHLDDNIPIFGS